MKLIKKRIYSLENNIPRNLINTKIVPAIILDIKNNKNQIIKLGFSEKMEIGETILPASVGPISNFNSKGKEILDKTKPKETRYREIEWCWKQWAGRGRTETVCDYRLVPYERWQRIFISPPSIQLTISKKETDKIYISAPVVELSEAKQIEATHKINLFLELFKSCDILNENQVPIIKTTKSLNWTILPPGKKPWVEQKKLLQPFLDLITDKRAKPVFQSRLEDINNLTPDFTAIGNQGFGGYVIFGFSSKNIFILESAFYGNAIYVFNENWESLSQKTKAEILNAKLQVDRITHSGERTNWLDKLTDILK